MWLKEDEFEEMLARYWEQEDDRKAMRLVSVKRKHPNVWDSLVDHFRRLTHGANQPLPKH